MGTEVGVGKQDGGSSSCHMSVHRTVADCKTVSAHGHLLGTNRLKASAFVLLKCSLVCNGHQHSYLHRLVPLAHNFKVQSPSMRL